jgi:hypothetical protein
MLGVGLLDHHSFLWVSMSGYVVKMELCYKDELN